MNLITNDYLKNASRAVNSSANFFMPEIDVYQFLVLIRKS